MEYHITPRFRAFLLSRLPLTEIGTGCYSPSLVKESPLGRRRGTIERQFQLKRLSRRQFQALLASGICAVATPGCGTLLYPERIGQPRGGPLDWKVVALDTIGLLLFLVPGIISFVVDFHNGTIFLPPCDVPYHGEPVPLTQTVPLERGKISLADIEKTVEEKLAIKLDLKPGTYVTRELESLDQYRDASQKLALAVKRGEVRCQSPDSPVR